MTHAGEPQGDYGQPSPFARLKREQTGGHPTGPRSRLIIHALQDLNGTITPNSLHFERHHSGIPAIDPSAPYTHYSTVMSDSPCSFSYEDLLAYPMETHQYFLECSGNSFRNTLDHTAGSDRRLAEWPGLRRRVDRRTAPLSARRGRCGDSAARWVIAEGADAAGMTRSVPMSSGPGQGHGRPVPEWRAASPGPGLSHALVRAGQ